eukprot:Rmarinus@m.4470
MVVNRDYLGLGRSYECFSTPEYITIGDEYIDPAKKGVDARHKSKQFQTNPAKSGTSGACGMDALFEKQFQLLWNDQYEDAKVFNKDAEHKKGFLSSVPHNRDEFSNVMRTEQWRETLRREDHNRKTMPQPEARRVKQPDVGPELAEILGVPKYTYDIIGNTRPVDGSTTNKLDPKYTTWDSKSHRDRFYTQRTLRGDPASIQPDSFPSKLRKKCKLSSGAYGASAWEVTKNYQPSEFVRRPIIADSFYRDAGVLPRDDNSSMFVVGGQAS